MFDFNLTSGVSRHQISMEHARELAGSIANSYFNAGITPTESLSKIAQAEELTPHQIELVAAEANKLIHQHKYASADEKYHAADFPLADAKSVISGLQVADTETKFAATFVEPKVSEQFDPFKAFGVEPEQIDKTASVRYELKVAGAKLELLNQKAQDNLYMAKEASAQAERSFIKQARQLVLDGDNSGERLRAIGLMYKFAKESRSEEAARPALAKLAYVLQEEGKLERRHAKLAMDFFLNKKADQVAPAELISENLMKQVSVVNGQHPLYISIKTLKDKHERCLEAMQQAGTLPDKLEQVRQKIREL